MITEDQRLMREGLKTLLDLEQDLDVVELAENGKDALEKLPGAKPDVILMDIRMPVMDGVEATRIIKEKYPKVKVLILTTFDDDEFIIEALKGGAVGYILKDLSSEKLVTAIIDAHNGNSIMQPEIAAKIISHITGATKNILVKNIDAEIGHKVSQTEEQGGLKWGKPANFKEKNNKSELTDREKDILNLVGEGMSNTEIAKKLYISVGTVKNYISSLYSKLEVDDRSKLTLYAIKEASKNS